MSEIYCCGYCGAPSNKDGSAYEGEIPKDYNPDNYEKVQGDCCREQNRMMQVTHDMAIDGGCPEMEGQWIKD